MASLWTIPKVSGNPTPLSMLREQAAELNQATNYDLRAEVSIKPDGDNMVLDLAITVPALSNYRIVVLSYWQPVTMYAGTMRSNIAGASFEIEDDKMFLSKLGLILKSPEVTKAIGNLMAQAAVV